MKKPNLQRARRYVTLRLLGRDRELLQRLGQGRKVVKDRHGALMELAAIVPGLDLPNVKDEKRRPLRLGIPAELDAAIAAKAEETGQAFVTILIEAARAYRRRHPLKTKP